MTNTMINETQHTASEPKKPTFGEQLKSLREAKGLGLKEVAAQLRLSEKKIAMMERERYPADLPVTFIRGYLRAYGRFLQIPEHEIKHAVDIIKPKSNLPHKTYPSMLLEMEVEPTNNHYFMHFFTFLIVLTLFSLVGMWWYSHNPNLRMTDNQSYSVTYLTKNAEGQKQ